MVNGNDNLLSSWKEIARFLGISVKTAKRYHRKHGMPILRAPTGRVFALREEVTLWLIEFRRIHPRPPI